MPQSVEQTRASPKEIRIPPLEWKINWWGFLGLLCVIASASLSVAIISEVLEFLKANGIWEFLPVLG